MTLAGLTLALASASCGASVTSPGVLDANVSGVWRQEGLTLAAHTFTLTQSGNVVTGTSSFSGPTIVSSAGLVSGTVTGAAFTFSESLSVQYDGALDQCNPVKSSSGGTLHLAGNVMMAGLGEMSGGPGPIGVCVTHPQPGPSQPVTWTRVQ